MKKNWKAREKVWKLYAWSKNMILKIISIIISAFDLFVEKVVKKGVKMVKREREKKEGKKREESIEELQRNFALVMAGKPLVEAEEEALSHEVNEPRNKSLFGMITAIVYFILFILDYFCLSRFYYEKIIWGMGWNWGFAMFLLQVFYTLISFRTVGPKELGAILLFEKPLFAVESGLKFVPFLVCRLVKETRNVIEDELPTKPELIYRSKRGEEEVVPENLLKAGYKPPIRVQFGWPGVRIDIPEEADKRTKKLYEELNNLIDEQKIKDDPLNVRMTAETPLVVRWKIKSLVEFLRTFGSKEEAKNQIQDIAVAMLNREFSKITPAVAQAHLGKFSELIMADTIARIGSNSIEIQTILIRPFVYSHDLNVSLLKEAQARAEKKAAITNAEAQKEQERLTGEGKGLAARAILDGRTKGLQKMAKTLKIAPEIVVSAETAGKIIEHPDQKMIIAGTPGFTDLMTIAYALVKTAREEEKK